MIARFRITSLALVALAAGVGAVWCAEGALWWPCALLSVLAAVQADVALCVRQTAAQSFEAARANAPCCDQWWTTCGCCPEHQETP